MDAKGYIEKCRAICKDFEGKVECPSCPLFQFHCGLPDAEDAEACLNFVEEYVGKFGMQEFLALLDTKEIAMLMVEPGIESGKKTLLYRLLGERLGIDHGEPLPV